ncbi:universal stress protein [Halobacterium litoreum]|uniref:Universal stress protein n=1 Tax=Halobacterium litoreum TaxID=2039234 RepID=A0ABD5N8X9_9EURY|nr:universal stress protein [Halobacterium litoreum]UHH12081.1 universal stress protein [Halobacterium litoreum]
MTYVVAFDNTPLSRTALRRAVEYGDAVGEDVVAVTAIKRDSGHAREHGWLSGDETFDVETVAQNLTETVAEFDPDVELRHRAVDQYAPHGRVSRAIREMAVEADASVVFIGSDNAGRMVGGITSVGQNVSADDRYDVHIVRHDGA